MKENTHDDGAVRPQKPIRNSRLLSAQLGSLDAQPRIIRSIVRRRIPAKRVRDARSRRGIRRARIKGMERINGERSVGGWAASDEGRGEGVDLVQSERYVFPSGPGLGFVDGAALYIIHHVSFTYIEGKGGEEDVPHA